MNKILYLGGNKTQKTLQKSSNTIGQKHYLNNTTVHFNMQLKKVRHKKKGESHGQLVPNRAKAKGTCLQADTLLYWNMKIQSSKAADGSRREAETEGGTEKETKKTNKQTGKKLNCKVAPNSPIVLES